MFLNAVLRRNPKLIEAAFYLHQKGLIDPDTYLLDLDTIIKNAENIKNEADKYDIKLYFMTKQIGRNPYISKELMNIGYEGAVAVDFKEAEILCESGVKLSHVGHLVQIPSNKIEYIISKKPEVITVYSIEKAREISRAANKFGIKQNIMLRVIDKDDILYPSQYGGFLMDNLIESAMEIQELPNINIYGLTSFPCFLYSKEKNIILKTKNVDTLIKAKDLLEKNLNLKIEQMNMPSATCTSNISKIWENGGTHGEPGHALTGTTPLHAIKDEVEIPAIVYVSEISHNLKNQCFCYGGGYYRRSNIKNAFVGKNIEKMNKLKVETMNLENIDYYYTLSGNAPIGDTVIFSYRTQIFVTRSNVAVVKGIQSNNPKIIGIYDSLGRYIRG